MCFYGYDTYDIAKTRASRNKFVVPTLFLHGYDMVTTTSDILFFAPVFLLFD